MKRIIGTIALVALATACTPAQRAAVERAVHPTTTTTVPYPHAVPDGPATWGCPTFTYDAHGHQVYYQLNDMAYNEVSQAVRDTCVPIQQLIDAGILEAP